MSAMNRETETRGSVTKRAEEEESERKGRRPSDFLGTDDPVGTWSGLGPHRRLGPYPSTMFGLTHRRTYQSERRVEG